MTKDSLKPKHIDALVKLWLAEGKSPGTIKNRMSALRWWSRAVHKENVIARSNDFYGIPDRRFIAEISKAQSLDQELLSKVKDENTRMSLALQYAFGLRREEAIKIRPMQADQGDHLVLQASWTKGGKARTVPVRTEEQRQVLESAKRLAGQGALIPRGKLYIEQLRIYERHTANAGLSKMHGLRHAYAQRRYEELTGWLCPANGGPASKTLNPDQKQIDRDVRLKVSLELGHNRAQITAVYVGA